MGSGFFVVLLAMFVLMWFLMIRPQRQQQRRHAELLAALKVGDEVVTAGGIYGEVKRLDEERVRLEVDADVEIVVARASIARIVPAETEDAAEEDEAALEPPAEEPVRENEPAR